MKKIIIAHISKQHSFHTAVAIKRAGFMYEYVTTVYDKPKSLTRVVKKYLKGDVLNKASTRRCDELNDNCIVNIGEFLGLMRIFLRRFKYLKIDNFVMNYFGKNVAKYIIKKKPDVVILYDGVGKKYIDLIKRHTPHTKVIMEVTITSRLFMKNIFEDDMEKYNHTTFYKQENSIWNFKLMENVKSDFKFCDYYFVPSEIVKKSIFQSGVPIDRIYKIPYGVSCNDFPFYQKGIKGDSIPLKLLYVGGVMHRKGVHHLCRVVSQYSKNEVELKIAGSIVEFEDSHIKYKNCDNIDFLGFVTRDKIAKYFIESDVFVLPSLGEGLALVILEALATGTPVITSQLSGGNDAIINYENGIVYDYNNIESLKDAIDWFVNNRTEIPRMSKVARDTVEEYYTWGHYYKNLGESINSLFK